MTKKQLVNIISVDGCIISIALLHSLIVNRNNQDCTELMSKLLHKRFSIDGANSEYNDKENNREHIHQYLTKVFLFVIAPLTTNNTFTI